MPRGYRLAIIALGLTLVLGGQAQPEPGQAKTDTGESAAQEQWPPLPLPVQIVEEQAEKDARDRIEEESRHREIDGLIAQREMNEASQRMASAAATQNWIVGIGTVLLLVTVVLTAWASHAAHEAVRVTRDIGQKQLRPWMCCEGFAAQPFANSKVIHDGQTFTQGINFELTWKNRGLSPAIACELRHHVQAVPTGEQAPAPNWDQAPAPNSGEVKAVGVVGPNGVRYGGAAIFGDDLTAVLTQKSDVIVYGQLRYRDALDGTSCERISEARYRLTVNGKKTNADGTSALSWYSQCEGPQIAT